MSWPKRIQVDYKSHTKQQYFHVDNLKSKFNDFARANLYKVSFELNQQIKSKYNFMSGENQEKTEMLAKSIDIPAFDIGRHELKRMGQRIFLPASQQYGDMQAIFVCDDDYTQRKFLQSWLKHLTYDTDNNMYASVRTIADCSMCIYQFDNKYNMIFGARFGGVWPSSIGNVQLSYDSDSQISEFPVTFSYSTYEILTTETD